jgi:heme oxygenase
MTAHDATVANEPMPFSARLRHETRVDHERAESSPFVSAYLAGRLPVEGFAALQGQLWFVYDALESSARRLRGDPVLSPFLDPRLDRLPSLEADLRHLVGDDWPQRVHPSAATESHATRIREVARAWPAGYIAHHYLRYLGDLSGGRALGSTARKLYRLDGDGVRFYRFDDIPSPREFKDRYRALLDAAPWSSEEQARIIDEARVGFRLTGAMFEELDRTLGVGVGA